MAICVTGASGGVGSRVVRHLLARGDPLQVVALARRPYAIPDVAQLTVRWADYDAPSSLRDAFTDVHTLVFISSDGVAESMRRHHEHVIAAASDAGVDHIVYTSIVDVSPDSGFYYAAVHRETEAVLAASGLSYCVARMSIFADFFVATWIAPALREGTLALPAGAERMSLLSRDDAARALAVAAVSRCEGIVELTGPAALTAAEISQITAAVARAATPVCGARRGGLSAKPRRAAGTELADRRVHQHVCFGPGRPLRCRVCGRRQARR